MNKSFKKEKHGYSTAEVDAFVRESEQFNLSYKNTVAELKLQLDEKETQLKSFKQKQDLIVKSIMGAVQKAEQIEQLIKQKYATEMEHLTAFHEQWMGYYNKLIESYPLTTELNNLNGFNRRMSEILTGDTQPEQKYAEAKQQFDSESKRLSGAKQKKYIGFIPVDGEEIDTDLGVNGFNPEESIRQMLRREAAEEEKKQSKQGKNQTKAVRENKAKPTVSSQKQQYADKSRPPLTPFSPKQLGASEDGFSFEEALNPTQQLSDILKDIGLEFSED